MKHTRSLLLKLAFVFQSSAVRQNPDMMEISFLCAVQYSRPLVTYTHQLSTWNVLVWDFPGRPEVRTQCFHGGGLGSTPGLISYKSQSTATNTHKQNKTKQNKIRNVDSEIVKIRNFFFFFFKITLHYYFLASLCGLRKLSSLTRIKPRTLAVRVPSPDHRTAREFPGIS